MLHYAIRVLCKMRAVSMAHECNNKDINYDNEKYN